MSFVVSLVFSALGVALITVIYQVASTVRFFNGADGADGAATPGQRNLGDLIAEGDWAATIIAATLVWTFGVVTNAAVAGSFTNWLDSILSFLVAAVIMIALTVLTMWLVDRYVITRESVKDMIEKGHVLPAAVMAAFLFAVAILVSYVVS
jgi:fumarate reductase subunit C